MFKSPDKFVIEDTINKISPTKIIKNCSTIEAQKNVIIISNSDTPLIFLLSVFFSSVSRFDPAVANTDIDATLKPAKIAMKGKDWLLIFWIPFNTVLVSGSILIVKTMINAVIIAGIRKSNILSALDANFK